MISSEYRIIEITAAAEKQGNLNLCSCGSSFFPSEVHGGANRKNAAPKKLRIILPDGRRIIETDIPTDQKTGKPRGFFRERKWVKDFIKANNLKPGDQLKIERKAEYEYAIDFLDSVAQTDNTVFVRNENQDIPKQRAKNSVCEKKPSTLFGGTIHKGKRIAANFVGNTKPLLFYQHDNGQLWQGDSIQWLKSLPSESVDMIFADPPYNIKKADWDNFESQEKYIEFSVQWIRQAARVLKSSGTLFVCGFSEILADLKHPASKYFQSCRWIIWHYKNKANLGKDWGRSHESIIHFRKAKKYIFNIDNIRIPYSEHTLKYPSHPQAETSQYDNGKNGNHIWEPHPRGAKPKDVLEIPQDLIEVPTTCNGMQEKTPHPTQKPEELLRKLILASSNIGDTILDPFCGSGTTPVCAEQLQRQWMACDLSPEYLDWAVNRLSLVKDMSIENWIQYDLDNQKRRNSIR